MNAEDKKTIESEKKIQKVLNQLISEEWIASVMYRQFILAAECKCQRHQIKELLKEISDDEMDDHYEKLVKFALHNDFSVPCQVKEYEKYASDNTVKQWNGWKRDKDADYYVSEAIKAEIEAIHSYETIMNENLLPQELLSILISNYYDEIDHLQKLSSMKLVMDSGVEYVYSGY